MGAGGEQERLAGVGAQGAHPAGHHLGVGGFLGAGDAADGQRVGVGGVGVVDAADGFVEAGGHGAVVLRGWGSGALWAPARLRRAPSLSLPQRGRGLLPGPAGGFDFAVDDGGERVDEGGPDVEGLDAGEGEARFGGLRRGGDVDVVEDFEVVGEELDGDDEDALVARVAEAGEEVLDVGA